jgi:hypothetical protein
MSAPARAPLFQVVSTTPCPAPPLVDRAMICRRPWRNARRGNLLPQPPLQATGSCPLYHCPTPARLGYLPMPSSPVGQGERQGAELTTHVPSLLSCVHPFLCARALLYSGSLQPHSPTYLLSMLSSPTTGVVSTATASPLLHVFHWLTMMAPLATALPSLTGTHYCPQRGTAHGVMLDAAAAGNHR